MVNCDFLDTGGAIRYRSTNECYYKKVEGFMVVFDITNRQSFEDLNNYFLPKIQEYGNEEIPVMIIGNKRDMKDSREVSIDEAYELAEQFNYIYKETSCLENYNLNEIFEDIIQNVKYYIENSQHYAHRDTITLNRNNHRDDNSNIENNSSLNNNRRHKRNGCC